MGQNETRPKILASRCAWCAQRGERVLQAVSQAAHNCMFAQIAHSPQKAKWHIDYKLGSV